MPSKEGPRARISYLLDTATDPVRISTLKEVLEILDASRRYGYGPEASRENKRKSDRNTRVNREMIDASIHRHQPYTEEELAVVANLRLNCVQVAVRLGRTPKGIAHQRRKLRNQ